MLSLGKYMLWAVEKHAESGFFGAKSKKIKKNKKKA
jgi:hypothetical protein